MRRGLAVALAAAALTAGAGSAVAGSTATGTAAPAPVVSSASRTLASHVAPFRAAAGHRATSPLGARATVYSGNWSGYVVTPSRPVTQVTSRFRQPAYGEVPPGFAAIWTGIGGYTGSDLIQAGTALEPSELGDQYYAWYEVLPDTESELLCAPNTPCVVKPGDSMYVLIKQVAASRWYVRVQNETRRWTWAKTVTYRSTRNSAEWVAEAPSLGPGVQTTIDGFGRATFTSANTFTVSGRQYRVSQGRPTAIVFSPTFTSAPVYESVPSALSSRGDGFATCTYAGSCARP